MHESDLFGQGLLGVEADGEQLELSMSETADVESPATEALRSIDELVRSSRRYRESRSYREFLDFMAGMRDLAPFNAMMVDLQKPGARYVLSDRDWYAKHKHVLKPNAQQLLILQPRGPFTIRYDVSDVEPAPGAKPLPIDVIDPLRVQMSASEALVRMANVSSNALAYGIRVEKQSFGAGLAGIARRGRIQRPAERPATPRRPAEKVTLHFEVVINSNLDAPTAYVTLLHEIAHIVAGHQGTVDSTWWPDRSKSTKDVKEIEAESIAFMVARRQDAGIAMPPYLDGYVQRGANLPAVSLHRIIAAVRDIEALSESARVPTKKIGLVKSKKKASSAGE